MLTHNKGKQLKRFILLILVLAFLTGLAAQEKRDPTRAALYSLVLPGGGQIYNHAYLKAGLVIGVQGFLIGSAIFHDGKRDDFAALAHNTQDSYQQQLYLSQSRDYKDKLNNDIWWIGITAALSVFDAYVDAHLSDFDSQKEKIRLRFSDAGVRLQYDF
jgi:hypothetical protein